MPVLQDSVDQSASEIRAEIAARKKVGRAQGITPTVYRKADSSREREHKKEESENHSAELVLGRTMSWLPHWPVVSTYGSRPQDGVWCVLRRGRQDRGLLDTFSLSWQKD